MKGSLCATLRIMRYKGHDLLQSPTSFRGNRLRPHSCSGCSALERLPRLSSKSLGLIQKVIFIASGIMGLLEQILVAMRWLLATLLSQAADRYCAKPMSCYFESGESCITHFKNPLRVLHCSLGKQSKSFGPMEHLPNNP